MSKLEFVTPKNLSGFNPSHKAIPTLKRHHYLVIEDFSISGDAPKDLIRLYEYGNVRKDNRNKWPLYIAKVGHKWYPNESITEYLLNRLGECLGFTMAASKLVRIGGQIRFLTKYFLASDQQLIHGAEIYADYLADKEFVEEVENQAQAQDFFTIQFTKEAIEKVFPKQSESIFANFIRMLIFDAIVGNNDRHFYNWGVIKDVESKRDKIFSPIYDTARGLYWNQSEKNVVSLYKSTDENRIKKYINGAKPKIGWEGKKNLNQFDLVKLIIENEYGISRDTVYSHLTNEKLKRCEEVIQSEFYHMISATRRSLIIQCLQQRHDELLKIIEAYDR